MGSPATTRLFQTRRVRLHRVTDQRPGIARIRRGQGFDYRDANGRRITEASALQRFRSLAIPPAWSSVWICPDPCGHIQATGRDVKGRKQYRYHDGWTVRRENAKTERLLRLAEALPAIRRRIRTDLGRPGLPKEKVLALMVRLLEVTSVRPGHREYFRQNGSHGLASLKDRHAVTHGESVEFRFVGKSGRQQCIRVHDPRLASLVRECRRVPGTDLFQYRDRHGQHHPVHAADLNRYLREISGAGVTAKDMRTWNATVAAWEILQAAGAGVSTQRERMGVLREKFVQVSERLGNTPTVCRSSYVHVRVQELFLAGRLPGAPRTRKGGLSRHEAAVLEILSDSSVVNAE